VSYAKACRPSSFLHYPAVSPFSLTNSQRLASNKLKGSIPEEIQHLSKLDELGLEHNDLTGSLPTSMEKLTHLQYLDLNFNQLTGSIPQWLGESLGALKALGLGHNSFDGTIPGSLGSSNGLGTNLKTLALDNNLLDGNALSLKRLKHLEYLYISNNDLTGRLDAGLLSDMPFLKEADLSHNRFSNIIPEHLFLMDRLRVLDLGNNDFSGSLPSGTQESIILPPSSMEFFSLRNNSMSSSIPESLLERWSNLTHLDLSMNNFTGEYPAALADKNGLAYLFLGENSFDSGPVPEVILPLTNLRELSLDNLQLRGEIPSWLQDFGQLKLLDLSQNSLTGNISLDFEKMPNLVFLMLNDNDLSGSFPESVASLQDLAVLSLHHNNVTGDASDFGCSDDSAVKLATVDCGDITCRCCSSCCASDDCFKDVVWHALEHNDGTWEEHFLRDDYAFNPEITRAGHHDALRF
jgi:Leucine-rich repeat (LRR) protein